MFSHIICQISFEPDQNSEKQNYEITHSIKFRNWYVRLELPQVGADWRVRSGGPHNTWTSRAGPYPVGSPCRAPTTATSHHPLSQWGCSPFHPLIASCVFVTDQTSLSFVGQPHPQLSFFFLSATCWKCKTKTK